MLELEAKRLREVLATYSAEQLSPMLNIGSSTLDFRTRAQPWIQDEVIAPLEARGVQVVHVDVREGTGVDLRANVFEAEGLAAIQAVGAKSALLCNVLEHVEDPALFTGRVLETLSPGGLLFVTVPNSYPYHEDPIDTMFRPDPTAVSALAPGSELMQGEVIEAGSYWDEVRGDTGLMLRLALRLAFPFRKPERWRRIVAQLYWLNHPYKITFAALRKPAA